MYVQTFMLQAAMTVVIYVPDTSVNITRSPEELYCDKLPYYQDAVAHI